MTYEEALSQLTHKCRRFSELKINPRHCRIRKPLANVYISRISGAIGWECVGCEGPLLLSETSAPVLTGRFITEEKLPGRKHQNPRTPKPFLCEICGTTDPTRFPYQDKTICYLCKRVDIRIRQREQYRIVKLMKLDRSLSKEEFYHEGNTCQICGQVVVGAKKDRVLVRRCFPCRKAMILDEMKKDLDKTEKEE